MVAGRTANEASVRHGSRIQSFKDQSARERVCRGVMEVELWKLHVVHSMLLAETGCKAITHMSCRVWCSGTARTRREKTSLPQGMGADLLECTGMRGSWWVNDSIARQIGIALACHLLLQQIKQGM